MNNDFNNITMDLYPFFRAMFWVVVILCTVMATVAIILAVMARCERKKQKREHEQEMAELKRRLEQMSEDQLVAWYYSYRKGFFMCYHNREARKMITNELKKRRISIYQFAQKK